LTTHALITGLGRNLNHGGIGLGVSPNEVTATWLAGFGCGVWARATPFSKIANATIVANVRPTRLDSFIFYPRFHPKIAIFPNSRCALSSYRRQIVAPETEQATRQIGKARNGNLS
jgi:hypothetical protein